MASGVGVIFQATFFDGQWLGLRRLPAAGRVARAPIGLGPVPLRGRRHEAGAARQGRRRAPDLQLRRAADAHPGRAARAHEGRAGRQRPRDGEAARRRLHGLLPRRQAALHRDGPGHRRRAGSPAAYPPTATYPGAGRALRRLPMGRSCVRARRRERRPPLPGRRASRRGSGRRSSPASSTPSCGWLRPRSRSIPRSTARAPPAWSACASRRASRSRAAACRSRSTNCCCRPRRADRARARAGHPARAGSRRPVPRPRGRPVRVRRWRRLPLRGHGRAGRVPAVLVLRPGRRRATSRWPARSGRSSS